MYCLGKVMQLQMRQWVLEEERGALSPPSHPHCYVALLTLLQDLNSDDSNCGACAKKCPAGQSCTGGKCICPNDQTDCSGVCKVWLDCLGK